MCYVIDVISMTCFDLIRSPSGRYFYVTAALHFYFRFIVLKLVKTTSKLLLYLLELLKTCPFFNWYSAYAAFHGVLDCVRGLVVV
jgi:hypothetical protein